MFRHHLTAITIQLTFFVTMAIPAHAQTPTGQPDPGTLPKTTNMAESGRASAPFAHIEFCLRSPSECLTHSVEPKKVRLNRKTWRQLKRINFKVNRSIRAKSDRSAHDKKDYWSVGERLGDCEDYALTKRQILMRRGWSSNSLLIATARDRKNRMHAVLIAHTNRGDFVLDNLIGRIRAWNKTGYKWLKRQSRHNPKIWVHLSGRPITTASIPVKSSRKLPKSNESSKISALAILKKIRADKKASLAGGHG